MKLSLDLRTSLTQTLTPQQIQYLKLLQLPLVQLEQQVIQEIEQNPMLEVSSLEDGSTFDEGDSFGEEEYTEPQIKDIEPEEFDRGYDSTEPELYKPPIDDQGDPFEFYKMLYQDEGDFGPKSRSHGGEEEDHEFFQIRDTVSFTEEILQQLRMQSLNREEILLGEQIVGNVDEDGYLRRELSEILDDTNDLIDDLNFEIQVRLEDEKRLDSYFSGIDNPARQYAISSEAIALVNNGNSEDLSDLDSDLIQSNGNGKQQVELFVPINSEQAEKVLKIIQSLDPPGFASRSIQECLIAQCRALPKLNAAQKLALEILENAYEAFTMKHYHVIIKQLGVTEDYLREALDVIRRLNPKPGGGDITAGSNTVIPDFIIERDEETNELIINVNDSRLPSIRVNKAYEKLKKEARYKLFNKETREWIRNKYEDAKFLIQAIRQRKSTMLKVMTAIAGLQKDFFYQGPNVLKPLIYKDVSEDTGLDISTVCRIVNGKYVQTEFGTFELKFFFSESLPNEDGEEISTRVIKQIIKDIIDAEPKDKPFSDDKIGKELKNRGYQIARRTVAKYREQLRIPVARLRREL